MKQFEEIQLDEIDELILDLLKEDAKVPMNKIGEEVHMTGQAVSKRIISLQKRNIIKGYTIRVDENIYGEYTLSFIRIFMKSTKHAELRELLCKRQEVFEMHRISGEGCYIIKTKTYNQEALTSLLDEILKYGNYQISQSIDQIK